MMTLPALARALGGEVSGRNVRAPGPGHSKRDHSMSITLSADSPHGFIANSFAGDDWRDCQRHVLERLGLTTDRPAQRVERQRPEPVGDDDAQRIARARALWRECQDARGTIVDAYLTQRRGLPPIDATTARTIRFHPAFPMRSPDGEVVRVPAMVAAMRDAGGVLDYVAGARGELAEIEQRALSDERFIRAVHVTALADDGRDKRYGPESRRIRGVAKGSTIVLGDLWAPLYGSTVFVGEGLETMASTIAMGAHCAFALGSAGAVAAFEPLPHVLHLRIVGENDAASERAVRECFRRWREHIDDVDVIAPRVGNDINDLVLSRRAAA